MIYLFPTVLELVGPVPRIFAANWSLIVWCFGLFLFALLVYCERNWFYLMLWLAIPTIPPLVFWMWELLTSSFFCIVIQKQMHRQLGVFFLQWRKITYDSKNVSMHNIAQFWIYDIKFERSWRFRKKSYARRKSGRLFGLRSFH